MLCVLDLEEPGLWKLEVISGEDLDMPVSNGDAMFDIIAQARARRACFGREDMGLTINSRVQRPTRLDLTARQRTVVAGPPRMAKNANGSD